MKYLNELKHKTLYGYLNKKEQEFIDELCKKYSFTFQEFRMICEMVRDLAMWGIKRRASSVKASSVQGVDYLDDYFKKFKAKYEEIKNSEKVYIDSVRHSMSDVRQLNIVDEDSDKKIFGLCPVASEKTVCCHLYTLDVVQKCAYGCSYCSIATFYTDDIVFDANIDEKLKNINIDPCKFYHIGTGQSSDALYWGNRNGILDKLCSFAKNNENILLEFKTKSDNIEYFLNNKIPRNVVCSWSLNTDTIIKKEEHLTPDLNTRLDSARKLADKGIKIAFHFHPMVYYKGWEKEYEYIAHKIKDMFEAEEVSFISFGSVTLIKPVIKDIRKRGGHTKILQMEMVKDPHGKITYPDEVKIKMFRAIYEVFEEWYDKVFFYLCMEKRDIWDKVFGWHYERNEDFEREFRDK